jgi:predicted amidophosphoribosyltransferase
MSNRSRRWLAWCYQPVRDGRRRRGLCVDCEEPRGEDGTSYRCRVCADAVNKANRERRAQEKAQARIEESDLFSTQL